MSTATKADKHNMPSADALSQIENDVGVIGLSALKKAQEDGCKVVGALLISCQVDPATGVAVMVFNSLNFSPQITSVAIKMLIEATKNPNFAAGKDFNLEVKQH